MNNYSPWSVDFTFGEYNITLNALVALRIAPVNFKVYIFIQPTIFKRNKTIAIRCISIISIISLYSYFYNDHNRTLLLIFFYSSANCYVHSNKSSYLSYKEWAPFMFKIPMKKESIKLP